MNMMYIKYILNNYQVGTMLRMTPTHKIVVNKRIDRSHTIIIYANLLPSELALCKRCYGNKKYEELTDISEYL